MRTLPRPVFATVRDYGRSLSDAEFWRPHVEFVARRHCLGLARDITPAIGAVNPVMLVDGRYVVKLFDVTRSEGARQHGAEYDAYRLAPHAPQLIAEGSLYGVAPAWPYLVSTLVKGTVWSRETLTENERVDAARWIGAALRDVHATDLRRARTLTPDRTRFATMLREQRDNCAWRMSATGLPRRLVDQVDDWLAIPADASAKLLHADLHSANFIGVRNAARWEPTAILDFGDAEVGDPVYDLVALHLDTFGADRALLRAFLDGYDWPFTPDFQSRAMAYTLLYRWGIFRSARRAAQAADSLDQLADTLWSP